MDPGSPSLFANFVAIVSDSSIKKTDQNPTAPKQQK